MGSGGAARAGCMGFSLVGLLVSVGVVLWLGSQVFDDVSSPTAPDAAGAAESSTTVETRPGVDVVADPNTGLTGDASITISASGLLPGEGVVVAACVGALESVPVDLNSCDATTETSATASATGKADVRLAVPRVLQAGGLPIDCAQESGRCEVRVQGKESGLTGALPLSFAEGLDPPDLLEGLTD